MHNMNGLLLELNGQYNDAFLYNNLLYLIDDEFLHIIDFNKLIEDISPEDADQKILFRYAFLNNNFFYKADNDFFEFFNMPTIKRFIQSAFDKIGYKKINQSIIDKYTTSVVAHNHPGVLHFEIYKNVVFLSNETGTYSYKILNKPRLLRKCPIFEYPSVHISALTGDTVYFSCAQNGLNIVSFDHVKQRARSVSVKAVGKIEKEAISIDSAYRDFIIRDLNNNYFYEFDTFWGAHVDNFAISPEERLSSYVTLSDAPFISEAKYVSATGNRIISFKDDVIDLLKMDYKGRTQYLPNERVEEKLHYNSIRSWENRFRFTDNSIYCGFQTVFGLVLDTDDGTYVIDDDEFDCNNLSRRRISEGENLKIRHFYRSINYSHIVISIKDCSIEIFSDLTDYFFPKDKKQIRKQIPRRLAMGKTTR